MNDGGTQSSDVAGSVPRYVTCPCVFCGGNIEFDANVLGEGERRVVPCPHCGLDTRIYAPEPEGVPPVIAPSESPQVEQQATPPDLESLVRSKETQEQVNLDLGLGVAYSDQGNYAEAVKCFTAAAAGGSPDAQCNLGVCYFFGHSVTENQTEGVKWFLRAAEGGHPHAALCLAVAYEKGLGIGEDQNEARKWLHRAAMQGDAAAQDRLSEIHEKSGNYLEEGVREFKNRFA